MRRYSRIRIILLTALLAAVAFTVGSRAQDAAAPPAAAPAAAAAPAGVPESAGEETKTTGLISIILGNKDLVSGTIAILSIIGLTLIIQGAIKNRESVFMPPKVTNTIREMIAQRQFNELQEFVDRDRTFISKALSPALRQYPSFTGMKEAMETAVGEQTAEQFRKIEYLNIIGNLGPLLGLLGTVLGMIEAFSGMANAGGQANPAQLAGGVSKALAHTFLGLMLAVPCLAAFGVLRTVVDRLTVKGSLLAEELLLQFKPSPAAATPAAPKPGAPAQQRKPAPPPSPAQLM